MGADHTHKPTPSPAPRSKKLNGVKHVIAVASGKGGVGKSTTAVNLAAALRQLGARVGILDADIYGPSIPMMVGIENEKPLTDQENHIYPVKAHGMEVMSMGLLSDDNTPVIWRGPMVAGIINQFINSIVWDELDYLVIDLPPGTGDTQLSLCQNAALSGAVIVTTPQNVALIDARKGLKMFSKVNVPVLGIVENMSGFGDVAIFKTGGGKKLAEEAHVPFLGSIPIDPAVCESGDDGTPYVIKHPDSDLTKKYCDLAKRVAAEISKREITTVTPDASKLTLEWN